MIRRPSACGLVCLACLSCGPGVRLSPAQMEILATLSADPLPPPPADVTNRYSDDPATAALGQNLFFDPRFSGRLLEADNDGGPGTLGSKGQAQRVACAGCHVPSAGFLDARSLGTQISLAAGWGHRRTPSLLDVGQARLLMWDGRRDALFNQPFGPLESPLEMNSSRLFMAEQLYQYDRAEYEAIFGPMPDLGDTTRFPALSPDLTGCTPSTFEPTAPCQGVIHGMPGDGAEYDGLSAADQDAVTRVVVNAGKAIAAYERLLSCGPSRFDAWIAHRGSLTDAEIRGAGLFVGKAGCVACHTGPFLTDHQFHNVGLQPATVAVVFIDTNDPGAFTGLAAAQSDPLNSRSRYSDGDDGRLAVALDASFKGAFKTPSLRCVSQRPSFMHTGQLRELQDVVAFFNRGGDPYGYPGHSELKPLGLSLAEQQDLVAFLASLRGPGPQASLRVAP